MRPARGAPKQGTSPPCRFRVTRASPCCALLAAAFALGLALASERWGGLVPCALCLLERWPYRVAIALGLLALWCRIAGPPARCSCWLCCAVLVGAALAAVHVGVEQRYWPSPLPECAAPQFSRRHRSPSVWRRCRRGPPSRAMSRPISIPGLPLSMAAMNLLYALAFAVLLAIFLCADEESVA